MNDSLLFAGREQRRSAIPQEHFSQLDRLGRAIGDETFAEKKVDEALTIRWLAKRTGRGEREVEAALPSVMSNYFGKEQIDPSQAYDLIVATEAAQAQGMQVQIGSPLPTVAGASAVASKPEAERDTANYPGWQIPRALGSGFQEIALQIPQGGFSAAAALFADSMPKLNDGRTDADFVNLSESAFKAKQEAEAVKRLTGVDAGLNDEGKAALVAFESRQAQLNESNKQELDNWKAGNADSPLRKTAEFWRELADATDERWGVDPVFANTAFGQFVKSTGSMPATSALMALGGVGLLGVGSATFAQVENERMAYEGENYDARAALFSNFINAGGQTVLEKVIELDGVLEKALKTTGRLGGKVVMSDYLKNIAKTAAGEGVEELLQGQWDDMVATVAYDEQRGAIPFVDEGVAGRRFYEFMAGAAGGALMAGTFGGVMTLEQNRNARKAGEYLTTRSGSLLNEYDFKAYRAAYTDAQLVDMKDGETLLKAANGDKQAQSDYNKAAAAAAFISTDGMVDGEGNRLGSVDGKPAVFKADGSVRVIDPANPDAMRAFQDLQREMVAGHAEMEARTKARKESVDDLVDYITRLQIERGGSYTIEKDAKAIPLLEHTKGDRVKAQEIYNRYIQSGDLPPGLDLEKLTIMGSSSTVLNEQAKRWETAIKIATGAKPVTVIEESVEDYTKRLLGTGEVTLGRIMAWRSEVEGKDDVMNEETAIEWVSRYGSAYATGKAQDGDSRLPESFRRFLERFAAFVRESLELGRKLMQMERDGALPMDFLRLLQESTGTVSDKELGARQFVPMGTELDAEQLAQVEASDGFPKIAKDGERFTVTDPDGNKLAMRDTVEDAKDAAMTWYLMSEQAAEREAAKSGPGRKASDELQRVIIAKGGLLAASAGDMSGELKAIADNMDAGKRLRFFRKNAMGLDAMREALVGEGFQFETVNDMLFSLDQSTRGNPVYAQGGAETFSLSDSRAKPEDASNVTVLPDGAQLVGPTTFSIEDYRGIHKSPVAEEGASIDNPSNIYPDDIYSAQAARYYGHFGDARDNEAIRIIQGLKGRPNAKVAIYRAVPKFAEETKAKLKELNQLLGYRAQHPFFPLGNKVVAGLEEKYSGEANYDKRQALVKEDLERQVGELEAAVKGAKVVINPGDWVTTTRAYAVDHGESALNGSYDVLKKTVAAKELFTNGDSIHEWGYSPEGSNTTFSITAFHGTPHKVDKFSTSKIGTGEGAQAYGWGLYFAENEAVAGGYQKQLSKARIEMDGVAMLSPMAQKHFQEIQSRLTPSSKVADVVDNLKMRSEQSNRWASQGHNVESNKAFVAAANEIINALGAAKIVEAEGNLYTVELLPDADEFLDWDKPIEFQDKALEQLRKTDWFQYAEDQIQGIDAPIGQDLMKWLHNDNTAEEASKMLQESGIPGIRYLDGASRGKGGTSNYVIFDESLVKIIEENGKKVEQAGATFSLAQTDTPEFKRWFGDSKVVDAEGKPLVVYHGTAGNFKKFNLKKTTQGIIWFTSNRADIEAGEVGAAGSGKIMELYASIQNPADWNAYGKLGLYEFKREGFDGAILKDSDGHFTGFVFKSEQLKSVGKNKGTFDPANPDITMAMEAPAELPAFGNQSRINELMAVLEKHGALYTNAKGHAELVRMRSESYQQSIDGAMVAERNRRKTGGFVSKIALPIDYRIERINTDVSRMLRDRTFQADTKTTEDNRVIGAMYAKAKAMGESNLALLDHALANGHSAVADTLAKNSGFTSELNAARAVFEAQMNEALELGVPLGKFFVRENELEGEALDAFRLAIKQAKGLPAGVSGAKMAVIAKESGFKRMVESYWPRRVMDRDSLLKSMGLAGVQEPFQKLMDKAEAKASAEGRALTESEIDALVDAANAAAARVNFAGASKKPGALKARVLETVTAEQLKFYYKGIDAAFMHNGAMRNYLETLRFFGKSVVFSEGEIAGGFAEIPVNVTQSVGAWITDALLAGKITDNQVKELNDMLVARFNYRPSGTAVQFFRMFSYLQNMTQVTSGITANLAETWQGFYDSGSSPYRYGKNFTKAIQGLSKISLADIGQDPRKVAQEFDAISGVDPKLKEALRGLFTQPIMNMQRLFQWFSKRIGMEYFSRVMKEAHINGAVDYLIASAQSDSLSRKQREALVRIFGENKATQVIADLRGGTVTDDVKFYAFNVLANWQPISLDQMPQGYLASPYGRVFYMYKTWMSAQLAGFGRAAGEDIASGDAKRVASGVTTLVYLAMTLVAVGIPVDLIVAMIQGRGFILSDSAANRLLGMAGMSQFTAKSLKQRQWMDFMVSYFMPPAGGAASDVIDDARAIYYAGDEISPLKLKTWRNLPVMGRVFNGYLGHSAEDYQQKIEAAGGRIALTGPEEQTKSEEENYAANRARVIKQYSEK